jgi:hypothetical protein
MLIRETVSLPRLKEHIMGNHIETVKARMYNSKDPENVKAVALAAQADEQRNATLAVLLTAPSSNSGLTSIQKDAIRVELLNSLGVSVPDDEED